MRLWKQECPDASCEAFLFSNARKRKGAEKNDFIRTDNGELGDCTMLPNGNIVFSRQLGASEVTPDKKIVWNYDGPPATEIHTAYPIDGIEC